MTNFRKITPSKKIKISIIVFFLIGSGLAWFGLGIYQRYYLSTADAYVNAHVIQIAPRITGKVIKLFVNNNQFVKQGAPLFDIDPEPYQLAVNSAKAELDLSTAELENATMTQQRINSLVHKKYLPPQDKDNSLAHFKIAFAKVEAAKATLAQTNLLLQYTRVYAPTSGWIANMSLSAGDNILENQQLFVLISNSEFWVDANFKETELSKIKLGQEATVVIDMYPHHPFAGVVESISGGAGTAFSLLPPQNATGNWVKITQRIPVRVRILNSDPRYPLRIGTSATVTIHLRSFLSEQNE